MHRIVDTFNNVSRFHTLNNITLFFYIYITFRVRKKLWDRSSSYFIITRVRNYFFRIYICARAIVSLRAYSITARSDT